MFILHMACREMRAAWRQLALFFLCIAVGVAAIVSVRSFTEQFARSLARQARAIAGGDVRVARNRPWTSEARNAVDRGLASAQVAIDYTETIETQTMVRAEADDTVRPTMVDLRAVQSRYPLYGDVRLSDGRPYAHAMLADRGAIVSASLLPRLGLQVGDRIRIGTLTFTIRAAAERVPGNGLNFSPMPRVLVDYDTAAAAGLTGFGSRVRYSWLFKTVAGQETTLTRSIWAEARQTKPGLAIENYRYVENWLSRSVNSVDGFTALVGLSVLVLGGIGVGSATRVFIQQRLQTIAILKCLGGRNSQVLAAYLTQGVALSIAGSLFGLLLAYGVSALGVKQVAAFVPLDLQAGLTWRASLQGVSIGVLVALLFSVPPLIEIRHVKPALVLRRESGRRPFDWIQLGARAVLMLALLTMAAWEAGSYRRVAVFAGGLAGTGLVLQLAGLSLTAVVRRIGHLPSFVLRHGIGSLHRPGNQTPVILFAVGLGALFLIAVRIHQINLMAEYRLDLGALTADMFLIDIQPDQRANALDTLGKLGATDVTVVPVVRARLVGAERTNPLRGRDEQVRRQFGGEWRLTYRDRLESAETIVAGSFWDAAASDRPEVSIEDDIAKMLDVEVGDSLVFDLLGRRITAPVTSLRQVDRASRSLSWLTRFEIVFRPGVLDAAPHVFVCSLKAPPPGTARAKLQNALVERCPNVTVIDALDDIDEIRRRVNALSLAVSLLGGFVYACGVLILVGSIAMTKFQRLYEAAILKTLGARKGLIVKVAVVEYGVLGLLAGAIGSAASVGVTWAMTEYGRMETPWHPRPSVNVIGVAATAVLVTIVGVLASWDVIRKKPLGTLREQ
jgi:putative ABC transport system permease protein